MLQSFFLTKDYSTCSKLRLSLTFSLSSQAFKRQFQKQKQRKMLRFSGSTMHTVCDPRAYAFQSSTLSWKSINISVPPVQSDLNSPQKSFLNLSIFSTLFLSVSLLSITYESQSDILKNT